ncbi:WD40/YVTN/BNR-like repeat-containing protein [Rhizomonospora bruguierae]|uniref:WD40/YVTN/BNR-like repeat-containing protein n=1 Tax=Rhizomonospora bruguierae TaxID=1581705 RepID=UPI001BD0C7BC|nr:sialidase family protein [Micromonospora sp. NBRC 107566]
MTDLRELLADVAGEPGPPSRLTSDALFAAGRRRRARRRAALTGALAGLVVAVVAGAATVVGGPQAAPPRPGEPPVTAGPGATDLVQWVGAGDAEHVYQAYIRCAGSEWPWSPATQGTAGPPACDKSRFMVAESADGGRTWGALGAPVDPEGLVVLGPGRLAALAQGGLGLLVSTDGGATWSSAARGPDVVAAPAGAPLLCLADAVDAPCTLTVVDPVAHRYFALAEQPGVKVFPGVRAAVPAAVRDGDRLWIGGRTGDGRPAVAESPDAGRSWTVTPLPACAAAECPPPEVVAGPSGVRYAVATSPTDRQRWAAFRWSGPGRWEPAGAAPTGPVGTVVGWGYVAGDGRLVLVELRRSARVDIDRQRYWAAPPGGGQFVPVSPPGLPDTVYPVQRSADGCYYALSYSDRVLYRSADGWRWSPAGSR